MQTGPKCVFNAIGRKYFEAFVAYHFTREQWQSDHGRGTAKDYQIIAIGYFNQFEGSFPKLDQSSLDSAEFRLCVAPPRDERRN